MQRPRVQRQEKLTKLKLLEFFYKLVHLLIIPFVIYFDFPVNGSVPPNVLLVLNNEHLIKDGIALEFLLELFLTFKQEKGIAYLIQALKKGGLESK